MKILVTGGTGYIGSHTVVELLNNNYDVIVIDNLYNSKKEVIDKISEITRKDVIFYEGDVCDKELLRKIFSEHKIAAVMHFAGYKAVGESVEKPIMYYRNNIDSTLSLCEIMNEFNVKNIVFSSSATVYGIPKCLPIKEDFEINHATNPYGETKIIIERILNDTAVLRKDELDVLMTHLLSNTENQQMLLKYRSVVSENYGSPFHNGALLKMHGDLASVIWQKKCIRMNYFKQNGEEGEE